MKQRNNYATDYDSKVWETGDLDHREIINPVVFSLLWSVKGKKILDLACGQGYFSRILAKKWAKMTGIDNSKDLISIAREKSQRLPITYFPSDAAKLKDIKSGTFDCVVSNMAFMDIKDITNTIKECSRVLKKDWFLVFSMVNPLFAEFERKKSKNTYFLKLFKYGTPFDRTNEKLGFKYKVTHYHRPINFYINTLAQNWFSISNYEEIATKNFRWKKITDKKFLQFIQEFPSFVIIKAEKK